MAINMTARAIQNDAADNEFEMSQEYDFSNAKRAKDVPHLAALQKAVRENQILENPVPDNFNLPLSIIQSFKTRAAQLGVDARTLIIQTLERELARPIS